MGAHFVESRRANVFPRLSSPFSSYIWIILLTHVLTRSQGAQSQRRGWRAFSECERLTLANCSESNKRFQAPERCERGACNLLTAADSTIPMVVSTMRMVDRVNEFRIEIKPKFLLCAMIEGSRKIRMDRKFE